MFNYNLRHEITGTQSPLRLENKLVRLVFVFRLRMKEALRTLMFCFDPCSRGINFYPIHNCVMSWFA